MGEVGPGYQEGKRSRYPAAQVVAPAGDRRGGSEKAPPTFMCRLICCCCICCWINSSVFICVCVCVCVCVLYCDVF